MLARYCISDGTFFAMAKKVPSLMGLVSTLVKTTLEQVDTTLYKSFMSTQGTTRSQPAPLAAR